jgi:hypothetical protein
VTLLHTLHLHYGRTGLSEMNYLRRSLADEAVAPLATLP